MTAELSPAEEAADGVLANLAADAYLMSFQKNGISKNGRGDIKRAIIHFGGAERLAQEIAKRRKVLVNASELRNLAYKED